MHNDVVGNESSQSVRGPITGGEHSQPNPLPLTGRFSAISPQVANDPFMQAHGRAYQLITGRAPTAFERATGAALWQAHVRLSGSSYQDVRKALAALLKLPVPESSQAVRGPITGGEHSRAVSFLAVSAATGSGKTVGTCALMAHLSPAPCAFVIKSVEECEKVYQDLNKLLPGKVAVYTGIHKINASPALVEQKHRELGISVTRRFTEDEFRAAQVVITTHERWKQEIEHNADLGVRCRKGHPRALVVVDEDPSLERVFVRQPEDVSQLASVLADHTLRDEARAFGFSSAHQAAETLEATHRRMRAIKDNASGGSLYATDLITASDMEVLDALTFKDVSARMAHLPPEERMQTADALWGTVEFLRAASQGRVFYSRGAGVAAFFAYALMLPPQPRTLILDGTADLNGMYAVGSHVIVAEHEKPNYANVDLAFVNPPAEFIGKMRPDKLLKARRNAEPFMRWFMPFLLEHTKEGEEILVYAKQRLLDYDLHKSSEWDQSGSNKPFYSELQGRKIHWCHFGRGRGSNNWKHCTVYFRLSDGHMPKAALLARIGSMTGKTFGKEELVALSCGSTRAPLLQLAQEAHLVTAHKQDAARICIRNFANDGTAEAARLYLVDCDKTLLTSYRERMFPGASKHRLIGTTIDSDKGEGVKRGGVGQLLDLLLTTEQHVLTSEDIKEHTGIKANHIDRALASPKMSRAASAHGWIKTTRKAVGLSGKGYVLARQAVLAA